MSYPSQTGAFLKAVYPEAVAAGAHAYDAGDGVIQLVWPDGFGDPPSEADAVAWSPSSNLTDVEKLAQGVALYRAANEAAKEIILSLMVKVSGALIAFELFTLENVNDEGTRFVTFHRNAIVDYKQAGRNQLAAQALYDAINSEESRAAFTWLAANGGAILGIFASDLGAS